MKVITTDIAVIGAGGAGLRTAIAAAEANPNLEVALISKVYPMRSHTVAAEGGSAAVIKEEDSLDNHFNDTVGGGDWLCEQDVVEYFVANSTREMIQMEQWGCPWSRKDNGEVNVRRFGGMKVERTWFAADKTGFHMLHTLFQTSMKYPQINRFDEYFVVDLLVVEGEVQGLIAIHMAEGELVTIKAKSVVLATGGAGRVYHCNTNGGIVTGDGMAMAYRHGVPLRDMEFVQYHPTGLPGTGILMTEGCRGKAASSLTKTVTATYKIMAWGQKLRLASPKTNTWNLAHETKCHKLSGMNSKKATPSNTHWVMWYTLIYAISAKSICKSVCRSSVNWRKLMSTLILPKSRSQFAQPCITPWAVLKPMVNVKLAFKVFLLWVSVRLWACTEPTV